MSLGQGSVGYDSLKNFAGAPPFPANAADNGLSVDPVTGRIVIGQTVGAVGDPGQLLSNREIPLKGFSFTLGEALNNHFIVNPTARAYFLGDINTTGNGTNFSISDATQLARISSGGGLFLDLNASIGRFRVGDISGLTNASVLEIDDAAQTLKFVSGIAGDRFLLADVAADIYQFGDIDSLSNSTLLSINNATQYVSVGNTSGEYLSLDIANDFYSIGDDFNVTNGTVIRLNNGTGSIAMRGLVNGSIGSNIFGFNTTANFYNIGDLDNMNNGLSLKLNDVNGRCEIDNGASNSLVRINGVDGFTGTVTPVNSITVNGGIVTAVS